MIMNQYCCASSLFVLFSSHFFTSVPSPHSYIETTTTTVLRVLFDFLSVSSSSILAGIRPVGCV